MKRTTLTAAAAAITLGSIVGVASVRLPAGPPVAPAATATRQTKQAQADGYWRAVQFGGGRSEFVAGPWHWSDPAPSGVPQVEAGSRYPINDATGRH
jgi:hypothetical protein